MQMYVFFETSQIIYIYFLGLKFARYCENTTFAGKIFSNEILSFLLNNLITNP